MPRCERWCDRSRLDSKCDRARDRPLRVFDRARGPGCGHGTGPLAESLSADLTLPRIPCRWSGAVLYRSGSAEEALEHLLHRADTGTDVRLLHSPSLTVPGVLAQNHPGCCCMNRGRVAKGAARNERATGVRGAGI